MFVSTYHNLERFFWKGKDSSKKGFDFESKITLKNLFTRLCITHYKDGLQGVCKTRLKYFYIIIKRYY